MAIINVNTTRDDLFPDPRDGLTSLREAINQAYNTPEDDTILLEPYITYTLSEKWDPQDLYPKELSFSGHSSRGVTGKYTLSAVGGPATIDAAGAQSIIDVRAGADVELNNLVFTGANNSDDNWAPITVSGNGKLKLQSCIITDNRSSNGIILNIGELTMLNSTIKNNIITGDEVGAAIESIGGQAKALISNSTISNNTSQGFAGGILNIGTPIEIINSTISNNVAEGKIPLTGGTPVNPNSLGGAGIVNTNGGNITIKNSTITGNKAPSGAGIWNLAVETPSYITLKNTIVAGNIGNQEIISDTQTTKEQPGVASAIISQGNNLIGNATGVESIFTATGDQKGTATSPLNPQLATLANNGGPTQTHALLAGSPSINKGSNDAPPQDQRGISRVGQPDIGAYESDILTNPNLNPGTVVNPPPVAGKGENVMRFWDKQTGGHFYTTKQSEIQDRLTNPGRYQSEGNEFDAPLAGTPGTLPVYRYLNKTTQTYFYTMQAPVDIIAQFPVFANDGIAFYAYKDSQSAPTGSVPIHRFYNNDASAKSSSPVHFFTGTDSNKQTVMNTLPSFKYEGAGFYDFPKDYVV